VKRFRLIENSDGAEMRADPDGAYVLYAEVQATQSESASRAIQILTCMRRWTARGRFFALHSERTLPEV
jgi:hypothetical protein